MKQTIIKKRPSLVRVVATLFAAAAITAATSGCLNDTYKTDNKEKVYNGQSEYDKIEQERKQGKWYRMNPLGL